MNTCRVCKKADFEPHKYPLVKYGVRHYAHADCGLRRDGAKFFDKLTPYQLQKFPVFAAVDAGLENELKAAAAARPVQVHLSFASGGGVMAQPTFSIPIEYDVIAVKMTWRPENAKQTGPQELASKLNAAAKDGWRLERLAFNNAPPRAKATATR